MELVRQLADYVLHLDHYLGQMVEWAGPWTYVVLALIVFCETGLVVTPFLPGDSLLFAAGALCGLPAADEVGLNVHALAGLLIAAAVAGDAANYTIGDRVGARMAQRGWIKQAHLERTRVFFEKHGPKAIVLARFAPIVRTIAPFVAGMGTMPYAKFFRYNVIGGVVWVVLFLYAGYFFGNIAAVKERFSLVIVGVIVLSLVPIAFEWFKERKAMRAQGGGESTAEVAESAAREASE